MSVNPRVSLFNTITYTRDALGLAGKINNIAFTYDKNSIQTQLDYPNQSKEKNSFDAIYNIKKIESANQTLDYTQDKTGLITKKNNTDYTYDKIGRLTKAGAESFSYDKAGNNQNNSAVYNTLNNQMSESLFWTITYDNMGNIKTKYNKLTKTKSTYTFNQRNQLIAYKKEDANKTIIKTLTFTYDTFNRRVSKTEDNNVTHKYLYDGDDIVAILDEQNNAIATITHDESIDTPLSITNANGTFYYHRDHQGSIIALTDSSGAVVESFVYDNHYGTITKHTKTTETNNPYGYTGRELDTEELYYYRARYYDPSLQRFISEDLIGFLSGDVNFYRYVENNPVLIIDPSGNVSCRYSIAKHTLTCTSNDGKKTITTNDLHSGNGECTNNPSETCIDKEDGGPVPPDDYNISPNGNPNHEGWWALQSKSWTPGWSGLAHKMGIKRAGFNIHLGSASNGCLTLNKKNPDMKKFFDDLSNMFKKDGNKNDIRVIK